MTPLNARALISGLNYFFRYPMRRRASVAPNLAMLNIFVALLTLPFASAAEPFSVTIRIKPSETLGELRPIWRFFGADEPNYAYLKHGRKLLRELGELRPKRVYFRTHNLLTSGD